MLVLEIGGWGLEMREWAVGGIGLGVRIGDCRLWLGLETRGWVGNWGLALKIVGYYGGGECGSLLVG